MVINGLLVAGKVQVNPVLTIIGLHIITYPIWKQVQTKYSEEIHTEMIGDENLYFVKP